MVSIVNEMIGYVFCLTDLQGICQSIPQTKCAWTKGRNSDPGRAVLAHLLESDEHDDIPGAQAGKVGQEAAVEGGHPVVASRLGEAVQDTRVLLRGIACSQRVKFRSLSPPSARRQSIRMTVRSGAHLARNSHDTSVALMLSMRGGKHPDRCHGFNWQYLIGRNLCSGVYLAVRAWYLHT